MYLLRNSASQEEMLDCHLLTTGKIALDEQPPGNPINELDINACPGKEPIIRLISFHTLKLEVDWTIRTTYREYLFDDQSIKKGLFSSDKPN